MWQPNALEKCQSQRIHRQTSKNRTWFRWSQIPHLFKWMTEQLHGCGLWVLQAHWRKKKRIKRMEKTKTKLTCVFCNPMSVGRDLEHMWHFIYFHISQIKIELTDDWREREVFFSLPKWIGSNDRNIYKWKWAGNWRTTKFEIVDNNN